MDRRHFLLLGAAAPLTRPLRVSAECASVPIRGVYGVQSSAEPFSSMSNPERIAFLNDHCINAVFVKTSEPEDFLRALGEAGIERYVSQACFTGRSLYREHPEWRPVTSSGETMEPDGWYHGLSPTHPELRRYRLNQVERILRNPLVDGLWLDFIRYPVRWEGTSPRIEEACFAPHSLRWFEEDTGISVPEGPTAEQAAWILETHPEEWRAFKVEVIRSWVGQVREMMNDLRPDMKLGLFLVPWLEDDFDNAIKRIVAQDAAVLAPLLDVISPMLYHDMIGRSVERIAEVTRSVKAAGNIPVWPITQAMSEPGPLSAAEFQQAIDVAATASETGVLVFGANHIENENRWAQVKTAFHSRRTGN